ncbi:MAG: RpiB/LacA/LacB family sugar-phosphate isomerase [Candidatus Marsarchaeota archaeon]|jgi:ribose 5-phosphate isomerase RpiB|nr:RpiB/LacA/LacB family sugar-phosphate isomerase [Candidatus Marsarchaeota archaeon]MCL5418903.1 RpiB/LacA/LacB family sugar-phosphate isomerase [Candidatus Marsarchaeota archaeon]
MKAFIASENVRHGILLSNTLNASGINTAQSDSGYSDADAMISDLSNNVQSFDVCFAISRKPIDLSIDANKAQGIRAAYCKDFNDIINARKAGANVMVLDASNASREKFQSMVEGWLAGEGFQVKGIAKTFYGFIGQKSQDATSSAEAPRQEKKKSTTKAVFRESRDRNEEENDEDDDKGSAPKGKGIISKIKYSLGLE